MSCGPVVIVTGENNAQNDDFKLNFIKRVGEGKLLDKTKKNCRGKNFNLLTGEKKDYEYLCFKSDTSVPLRSS